MAVDRRQEAIKELARRELERRQAGAQTTQPTPPPAQGPSQLEAGARGLAQGISLNFADEASGAIGAAVTALSDTVSNFASGKMEFGDFVGEYQRQVEEARAADAAASEAFPKTFGAGQVVGTIAPAIVAGPAGAAAKGVMGVAKVGSLLGGVAAAGASEADLTKGEVGQLAEDALLGSAIGAAAGAGGEVVGKALGAAGRKLSSGPFGTKLKDIAANVIRPKAVAADLRNASKASTKKAFDPRLNKNLERGVEGLQRRGVIPTERTSFQGMDKREMFKVVQEESKVLGKSIENVARLADDAGASFQSNKLGIDSLRKTAKEIRKSSTSDEFHVAVDNVTDLLTEGDFKATDLFGIKQELDGLIKTGQTLKAVKKSQMKNLMKVRTQIKESLESKIDDAALNSPEIRAELETHGVKKFSELNDAFGDTAVVRNTLADAAALADFEEGAFQASPLSEQIGKLAKQEGVISAVTGGLGRAVGAASERGVRAAGAVGQTARAAAKIEQRSALVARQLYQSLDEDNVINDDADRKAHAGRVMNNPTLSHAQKFREVNMLQTTGKINPESIPKRDMNQVLKAMQAHEKALEEEIRRELGR